MDSMQPVFCTHLRSSMRTCFGFGVPSNALRHQKEDRNDPVPVKKIERLSSMDDVGVFGIVAQAVDWRKADGAGEAAAFPVGARRPEHIRKIASI